LFLKNSTKEQSKKGFSVENSQRAIIKSIKKINENNFEITVISNDKQIAFQTKDYNNFNHCYAVSTHKSQGKTVDNLYHLGNANLANAQNSYVNGSRHREQYKLYLQEDQVERYKTNAVKVSIKETTLNDSQCQKAVEEYVFKKLSESNATVKSMPVLQRKQIATTYEVERAKQIEIATIERNKELKREQEQKSDLNKRKTKFDKSFKELEPKSNPKTQVEKEELKFYKSLEKWVVELGKEFDKKTYYIKLKEYIDKKIESEIKLVFIQAELKTGNKIDLDILRTSVLEKWEKQTDDIEGLKSPLNKENVDYEKVKNIYDRKLLEKNESSRNSAKEATAELYENWKVKQNQKPSSQLTNKPMSLRRRF